MSQQLTEDFIRLFELPPAMVPYLSYVADEQEMRLVVGMNGQDMTVDQIAALMGKSTGGCGGVRQEVLHALYSRPPVQGWSARLQCRDFLPPAGPHLHVRTVGRCPGRCPQ